MEDILDAKLNLSYKDYVLNDEDFFMGCPSMLTSEKAALAKVSQLYKKFKAKKAKFFDNDFGPRNADDLDGSAFAMYKTG
jgi:fructose-specific phosphotransferase system component IIB